MSVRRVLTNWFRHQRGYQSKIVLLRDEFLAQVNNRQDLSSMRAQFTSAIVVLAFLTACGSDPATDEVSGSSVGGAQGGANGGISSGAATDLTGSDLTSSDLAAGPAPGTVEDFEVNVGDRVFFDLNSSTINEAGRQTLDRQAAWLGQYGSITVTIEGHADERGTREFNLALGVRRANAAKDYLIALGVDPGRILTISYGEERPVDPGNNEGAWAQNRRAVTVVNLVN